MGEKIVTIKQDDKAQLSLNFSESKMKTFPDQE